MRLLLGVWLVPLLAVSASTALGCNWVTGADDLVVAISCTGRTGFTDYLVRRAIKFRAKVVVITADPDSPLTRGADKVLTVPAEAEDIVVRAAVFEHAASLCLDAVFNVLADQLQIDLAEFHERHANLE